MTREQSGASKRSGAPVTSWEALGRGKPHRDHGNAAGPGQGAHRRASGGSTDEQATPRGTAGAQLR